jgi:cytoskeletal protein CcmA (bactofilin family)
METNNRTNDLIINGNGVSNGGMFRTIRVNGSGTLKGDADALDLKVNGICDFLGNTKAETGKINGRASFFGNFDAQVLNVNGMTDIAGNLTATDLTTNGQTEVKGKVATDRLTNRGLLRIDGDCNAETFSSEGVFNIKGMLNSGTIDVRLYHTSFAREIGGERISVRKGASFEFKRFIKSLFPSFEMNLNLNTDSIEGDEIALEYTKAKVVRGNNINIGPGCEIDLVEYKGNFTQAVDAKVGRAVKV